MCRYVALRGPTYRENSHANHTWCWHSRQTACFKGPEPPSLWVRFPSPAPLCHLMAGSEHRRLRVLVSAKSCAAFFLQVRKSEDLRRRRAHIAHSQCPIGTRLRARSARNTLETSTGRIGGLSLLPVIDLYQSRTDDRALPCSGESVNRRALLLRTQRSAIEPSRGSSGSATDSSSTS
jgi:hypothetical protein